jgi:hypothetical protein
MPKDHAFGWDGLPGHAGRKVLLGKGLHGTIFFRNRRAEGMLAVLLDGKSQPLVDAAQANYE